MKYRERQRFVTAPFPPGARNSLETVCGYSKHTLLRQQPVLLGGSEEGWLHPGLRYNVEQTHGHGLHKTGFMLQVTVT